MVGSNPRQLAVRKSALDVRQQNKDITNTDSVQNSISRPRETAKKALQVEKSDQSRCKAEKGQ
jgi:hypothetical protein